MLIVIFLQKHLNMGKDESSKFNEEAVDVNATQLEETEIYINSDTVSGDNDGKEDHSALRHRNRNSSKGEGASISNQNRMNGKKNRNKKVGEEIATAIPEQLPGVLTKETFQELANFKDGITVSLYIPTEKSGVEVNEHFGQIGFKNTLNTVEQQLKEKGYDQTKIEALLKPGFELFKDNKFWLELTNGLGIFIAEGLFKFVKMPVTPQQKIVIEPTFYVTPLVPLLTSEEYFYLLTISKKTLKLFKADRFGMQIVPIVMPQDTQAVKNDVGLDAATSGSQETGKRTGAISITGLSDVAAGDNTAEKSNLASYFEAVDDILWEKVFNKENAPLLLAGVEYEIPIYKSVCDYHNVWEASLTGNREYQETAALYADAREIMQPYFDQKKIKALEMYGNKSASQLTSSIVADVIPATYYGRVSHLFVSKGEHVWGTFDEMENKLTIHENIDGVSEDLIDNAVVKTLATGGEVYVLDRNEMPAASSVAALMRY